MGWSPEFNDRVASSDLSIGIIGLGYVGLPTAIGFHDAGFTIWGVDTSEKTIDLIKQRINPIGDPDIDDIMPDTTCSRWNIVNSSEIAVPNCDVILVTVPTPITEDLKPDLTYVRDAGISVFKSITKGSQAIVVLESTVYPGVTEQTWLPEIENLGLSLGLDLHIAYCPERFNPGDPAHGVRQVARVIGCSNKSVGEGLVNLYKKLTNEDVRFVGKMEVAEAAKVIENVQRDINIALVNELARIMPKIGVDVEDVLSAAATKWNFHRYTPGVGVGGHCIPVDPYYMMQRAADIGVPAELISSARTVNRTMPLHVAEVIYDILNDSGITNKEGRVLFLGWSYKAGIGDPRETPAEPLFEALKSKGVTIGAWDPLLNENDFPSEVEVITDIDNARGYNLVVLITAHDECLGLDWERLAGNMERPIVFDGRRVLDLELLQTMGWEVYAIGKPTKK